MSLLSLPPSEPGVDLWATYLDAFHCADGCMRVSCRADFCAWACLWLSGPVREQPRLRVFTPKLLPLRRRPPSAQARSGSRRDPAFLNSSCWESVMPRARTWRWRTRRDRNQTAAEIPRVLPFPAAYRTPPAYKSAVGRLSLWANERFLPAFWTDGRGIQTAIGPPLGVPESITYTRPSLSQAGASCWEYFWAPGSCWIPKLTVCEGRLGPPNHPRRVPGSVSEVGQGGSWRAGRGSLPRRRS